MKTFFLLIAFFSCTYSYSQVTLWDELREKEKANNAKIEDADNQKTSDLEPDSTIIAPEAWDTNFNNLLNSWYVKNYTNKLNDTGYQDGTMINDSVYRQRLSKLPNIIELPYNETVRKCINLYVDRRRELVEYMLGLEPFYFPMIEESLDKYGLPLELKYLTIVESALNPIALSRAGASGLWQFMISTGKIYGLEINSLVDERRDPIKSTDAACRYLKDLYDTFGDWNLAIAAYNCGAGNVIKAIRRAGGKNDYWAIYPYLPRETRSYLPLFIAANYIMNYYAYHQFYPVQTTLPLATDTVMVTQMLHFDQIANVLQMDEEMLRALNPQYKRDIIPGNYQPQILKLPAIQTPAFVEKENEIASYKADELFTNRTYVEANQPVNHREKITYRVRSGETVLTVANKYGVSAANVRRWNGLKSNHGVVGKTLVLYVDNGGYGIRDTETKTVSNSTAKSSTSKPSNTGDSLADTVMYKVKAGDSLYTIAQKFPGYSHEDLMKLNNMTSSKLRIGQYILVPKI